MLTRRAESELLKDGHVQLTDTFLYWLYLYLWETWIELVFLRETQFSLCIFLWNGIAYTFLWTCSGFFFKIFRDAWKGQLLLWNYFQKRYSTARRKANHSTRSPCRANVLALCVCVCVVISSSHFKTILHDKRSKQSWLFCHIRLCISVTSVCSRRRALSKDLFLIKKNTNLKVKRFYFYNL